MARRGVDARLRMCSAVPGEARPARSVSSGWCVSWVTLLLSLCMLMTHAAQCRNGKSSATEFADSGEAASPQRRRQPNCARRSGRSGTVGSGVPPSMLPHMIRLDTTSDESPTPSPVRARSLSGRLQRQTSAAAAAMPAGCATASLANAAAAPAAAPRTADAFDPNDLAAMNARLAAGLSAVPRPPSTGDQQCRSGSGASGASLDFGKFGGAGGGNFGGGGDGDISSGTGERRDAPSHEEAHPDGGGSDSEADSGPLPAARPVKVRRIDVGMSTTGALKDGAVGREEDEGTSTPHKALVGSVKAVSTLGSAGRGAASPSAHHTFDRPLEKPWVFSLSACMLWAGLWAAAGGRVPQQLLCCRAELDLEQRRSDGGGAAAAARHRRAPPHGRCPGATFRGFGALCLKLASPNSFEQACTGYLLNEQQATHNWLTCNMLSVAMVAALDLPC